MNRLDPHGYIRLHTIVCLGMLTLVMAAAIALKLTGLVP